MNPFINTKFQIFHLSFLLILFLLSVFRTESMITTKNIRCMEKERQALVMFKEGLRDESGLLSSWGLTTDDCCEWRGVRCSNRTNHVVSLHLPHMQSLGGMLHPSLLALEYLTYLDLSFFHVSNSKRIIPKSIGSLIRLKYLNLSFGAFGGEIFEEIKNLSNLHYLDLSNNHDLRAKSLDWLSHLPSLRYLDLSGVDLNVAYDWTQVVNRLTFLTELNLSSCGLPGITSTIFPFFNASKSLSVLDLSDNLFGIELSRFQWLLNHSSTLTSINLHFSELFGGIPDDFGKLQSLEYLDISDNMLEGEITKCIGNLSSLKSLDLSRNQFNGTFPLSLFKLPMLETMQMSENQIQGHLPKFLPSSPLIILDLSFNKLNGSLPPSMGNLTELERLDLSFNDFTGFITEFHLRNLFKLEILILSNNSLIFELNSDWVPPFNLTQLHLVNCEIGPHFPMWLRSQTYLEEIVVSRCGIDDVIPNWFGHNFHRLSYLSLSNNEIHGTLPNLSSKVFTNFGVLDLSSNKFQGPIVSVCNFTGSVVFLDLSNNHFSGAIPNCLKQLNNLEYLSLRNNNLSGKIPSLIGKLTWIQSLHLRNNSLDGELPTSLQQCKHLSLIDVGHNKLRGKLPRWLGSSLRYLLVLNLRSNQFRGTIPSNICHLRNLGVLDLSYNRISGTIPKCFGNFTSMANMYPPDVIWEFSFDTTILVWKGNEIEYTNDLEFVKSIDLSSNRLSGEIPSEITYLKNLVALNVSRNNLHGKIPLEIGRLQQLDSLDLSRNQLDGTIPLSLSQLTFLGFLDLSTNNLSGRIPSSTQLQSFEASSYSGNAGLCGLPLPNLCPEDRINSFVPRDSQEEEEEEERFTSSNFFVAMVIGFGIGLWGTLGCLLVNRTWRVAYFRLVSSIQDSLYVSIAVQTNKLKRFWNK